MKICIFGAGAIGSHLGAEIAQSGADITLVARGPHLKAMQSDGLIIRKSTGEFKVRLPCTDNPDELGVQDYIIITLKAHSVPGICNLITPLLGSNSVIVTASNGIPWWYFYKLAGPWTNYRVNSVDPDDVQWKMLRPERVIGAVVYSAAEIIKPGIVQVQSHVSKNRFPLGEPNGRQTDRIQTLSSLMINAGFKAPVRKDIRSDIWMKLWGNLAFNPISALTGATLDRIVQDTGTSELARSMMIEAQKLAEKLGVRFNVDIDKRIQGAGAVGAHRTSMLQDLKQKRPMEIDALIGAVSEIGRLVEVPTPTIDFVYALVRRQAIESGCYPD